MRPDVACIHNTVGAIGDAINVDMTCTHECRNFMSSRIRLVLSDVL